jgi:hypothetical protein
MHEKKTDKHRCNKKYVPPFGQGPINHFDCKLLYKSCRLTGTVRVGRVEVDGKFVQDFLAGWNAGSKPKRWEQLVTTTTQQTTTHMQVSIMWVIIPTNYTTLLRQQISEKVISVLFDSLEGHRPVLIQRWLKLLFDQFCLHFGHRCC